MATAKALTPEQMNKAASALVTATQNQATDGGRQIESDAAQLAPGLATASSAPGGYNYQRYIAPTVPALTAQYVTQAKQGALAGAMRDALNAANVKYNKAQNAYQARQRQYNLDSAKQAQEARQKAEREAREAAARRAAAYSSYGGGGYYGASPGASAASGVAGVNITNNSKPTGFKYVGNPDFRGWLLGNGHGEVLAYTGNNGKIDTGKVNKYGAEAGLSYAPGNADLVQKYVTGLYNQYKAAGGTR